MISIEGFFRKSILALTAVLVFCGTPAHGWSQHPHRQINLEAVKLFLSQAGGKEKFTMGPFSGKGLSEPLRGLAVTSSSLLPSDFVSAEANLSAQSWIINGGDWADEPNLYSSVRHFYDPLALSGVSYLTDQSEAHGLYDSPAIDARTWGLSHPDNPFSFFVALSAYKAALEVRDDLPIPPALNSLHFKTSLSLAPKDHDDLRSLQLARAYRALGESMHMLGDMTQPAHVRNDSHPADEPIEAATFSEHVRRAAAAPFVDSRIRPFIASAGGRLRTPEELFRQVASFVNRTFYSLDTIYDKKSNVPPNNRQKGYPSPQLRDLAVEKKKIPGFSTEREVRRFYGVFDGVRAAMIQDRLSFHWFDPNQSFLSDFEGAKEKAGRATAAVLRRLGPFQIPHAFAAEQGRILLPVAIHACADLMNLFYPTLELKAEFEEMESEMEGVDPRATPVRIIEVTASMKHHVEKDLAWKAEGLTIQYSGPALLVVREKDKTVYERKILFVKGEPKQIETAGGKMEEAPVRLFAAGTAGPLSEEELFYEIKPGQEAFLRIEAGSRVFESDAWKEEEVGVTILPPRTLVLELIDDASETEHEFEAAAEPKKPHLFEWNFGDGTPVVEDRKGPGENSVMRHRYTGLKPGDSFSPAVRLLDEKGRVLAEDSVSVKVLKGEKRHFFENRTFWMTGSPLGNDPTVVLPTVPLVLSPSISGIDGEIPPDSPEGKRLAELTEGVANAGDYIKEQMAKEMAKMGISLSDAQMAEALKQSLALAGLGGRDEPVLRRPVLGSGRQHEGRPVTLSLAVSIGAIPPIRLYMRDEKEQPEQVEARIAVRHWFFTTGAQSSPIVQGNGGSASVSWTPEKGKTPESFAMDLVVFYSLEFFKRTGEPWGNDGAPLRYENMSVSFPVGVYFCPVK
ncbi:hypothetical protein [Aminivibrio sp.]|uniref:hypothetical protein n=1 Tax=Aminivibrio sp. TaxID=1872489 RepID=UPI001A420C63|nr:hypothetical protein [Aminivibrio sp.]MBL3539336.1 hypothetical protein [Aminivibrio sp.]